MNPKENSLKQFYRKMLPKFGSSIKIVTDALDPCQAGPKRTSISVAFIQVTSRRRLHSTHTPTVGVYIMSRQIFAQAIERAKENNTN